MGWLVGAMVGFAAVAVSDFHLSARIASVFAALCFAMTFGFMVSETQVQHLSNDDPRGF